MGTSSKIRRLDGLGYFEKKHSGMVTAITIYLHAVYWLSSYPGRMWKLHHWVAGVIKTLISINLPESSWVSTWSENARPAQRKTTPR